MTTEQAYIEGFVKRASEYGYDENQALEILKEAKAKIPETSIPETIDSSEELKNKNFVDKIKALEKRRASGGSLLTHGALPQLGWMSDAMSDLGTPEGAPSRLLHTSAGSLGGIGLHKLVSKLLGKKPGMGSGMAMSMAGAGLGGMYHNQKLDKAIARLRTDKDAV
jgi:hypothetical protein